MRLTAALFLILFLLPALTQAHQFDEVTAAAIRGDFQTALKILRPLADQGNPEAEYEIGKLYWHGEGVQRDQVKAEEWFQKALKVWQPLAMQGDPEAQYSFGMMYYDGRGVPRDFGKSAMWLRKAAEQGNVEGQQMIGYMYISGLGVKQDGVEGEKWYRKAAEQGYAPAQFGLGQVYLNGEGGVKKDAVEAYFWISLSGSAPLYYGVNAEPPLTFEQMVAVNKRVADWKKAHLAPAAAPPAGK